MSFSLDGCDVSLKVVMTQSAGRKAPTCRAERASRSRMQTALQAVTLLIIPKLQDKR